MSDLVADIVGLIGSAQAKVGDDIPAVCGELDDLAAGVVRGCLCGDEPVGLEPTENPAGAIGLSLMPIARSRRVTMAP